MSDYYIKTALYLNSSDLPDILWLKCSLFDNYGDSGLFFYYGKYENVMHNYKALAVKDPVPKFFTIRSSEVVFLPNLDANYIAETFIVNKTLLD